MSSVALKISSLVIRTLSKPIANQIKAQAKQHERFRRICISFAQGLHQVDMRLRLGLLRDTATVEREAAKEAAEAAAKKHKHTAPTVKTEAATLAEESAAKNKDKDGEKSKPAPKPRIRPLSEAKAIDTGANFISEAFLFMVGGGLILFESWRSRRKENTRREDVSDRLAELEEGERAARRALVELERELLRIKVTENKTNIKQQRRILPKEVWELEEKEEQEDEEKAKGWLSRVAAYLSGSKGGDTEGSEAAISSNHPDAVNGKQSEPGANSSVTDGPPELPSKLPSSISAALERLNIPSQPPGTPHKEAPTAQTK